jgi:hypothetical protein
MLTNDEMPSLEEMREELRGPLPAALGISPESYRVEFLCEPKDVADDPAKLLVTDRDSRELAVVLLASPVDPDLVRRGMRIAARAREVLGKRLGSVILEPLEQGDLRGLSYTVLPYHRPFEEGVLARRYWRLALRSKALEWLAEVNEATLAETSDAEIAEAFERPLEHVATLDTMDEALRRAAETALGRLKSGEWSPKLVLMHGDLWIGNMLRASGPPGGADRRRRFPFVIIDWPGAMLRGYAMYDLIRLATSMGLGAARLEREVLRHCKILGSRPELAMGYLIASLGQLGLNLGEFPAERHREMSLACFNQLRGALG